MLKITVDIFSGRPNPTWIVTDEQVARDLLGRVAENPGVAAALGAGYDGLGLREVRVSRLGDDPVEQRLPAEFALASTAGENLRLSGALARELIEQADRYREVHLPDHDITPLDPALIELALGELERFLADPPIMKRPPLRRGNPLITTTRDARCDRCTYEVSQFNPGFWNTPSVQPRNNCYNYARNWRTDTFAQPGRAHGAQTNVMSCPSVTTAAMADGLHRRCDCLPDNEFPRRLMALVVAPGGDYHWYRHQRSGFWGHKPGHTAARNYDNVGALVTNPETAARGFYTDFCGYFYAGRTVVIS